MLSLQRDTPAPKTKGLAGVEHTLDVLSAFLLKSEVGVSEISRHLNFSRSAAHRILQTLARRGFLEQAENRRYRLGYALNELGTVYRSRIDLLRIAEPILKELSRRAQGNSHLAKLDGKDVVDLIRIESPSPVRLNRIALLRRPAHATALGKAILAWASEEVLRPFLTGNLPQLTRTTLTSPARLRQELERVRERGYAVDHEEYSAGIRCVAAPILNEDDEVTAAVSLTGEVSHFTINRLEEIAGYTRESARNISLRLGSCKRTAAGSASLAIIVRS
jgi:DNA-binding IclR family transcriptional regulator